MKKDILYIAVIVMLLVSLVFSQMTIREQRGTIDKLSKSIQETSDRHMDAAIKLGGVIDMYRAMLKLPNDHTADGFRKIKEGASK